MAAVPVFGCDKELKDHFTFENQIDLSIPVLAEELSKNCQENFCDKEALQKSVFNTLITRKTLSYAAIVSVMMGTSTIAAIVSELVSNKSPALTYFVATFLSQVTSIGFFVVGAPFWEPLQSKVRAKSYRMTGEHQIESESDDLLEQLYYRTNKSYSLNQQMSRNIITYYNKLLKQTLYYVNSLNPDPNDKAQIKYIATQIAEVMTSLTSLYAEVDHKNPLVTNAFRAAFTDFLPQPMIYREEILKSAKVFDPDKDYSEIVDYWLTKTEK